MTSLFGNVVAPAAQRLFPDVGNQSCSGPIIPSRPAPELIAELEAQIEAAATQGYTRGRKEGYVDGLADGRAAGNEDGAASVRTELELAMTAHRGLVESLQRAKDEAIESIRADAIELAFRIAERLLGRGLDDPDVLAARLHQALEAVTDGYGEPITVRTCPAQLEVFRAISHFDGNRDLDLAFEPDTELALGDLVIECRGRTVRSILSEQITRLEEAIRG